MKIKFITDFRGRETGEQYYKAGEVVDLPADIAQVLVNDRRAEMVADEKPIAVQPKKDKRK